jgi:aryl sulfotransferase
VIARTVWLASYPKSGNTWLRAVCTAWLHPGPVDVNALVGLPAAASRERFDVALGIPSSSLTPDEVDSLRPRVDEVVAAGEADLRIRKIHDALLPGPAGEPVVSVAATRGAVYVVRDPRAVAVSWARSLARPTSWGQVELNDSEAALGTLEGGLHQNLRQRLGTWSQHVRSWVDEAPFPVDVVRYEDLAATPVETFGRALDFIGFDGVTEARVADAVERASFERLRRSEQESGFAERLPETAVFFRRGEPESWRDELPADLAARILGDHAEVMARFGYR